MNTESLLRLILIATALSGWGKFIYERLTSKPKIKGEIFNVIIAQSQFKSAPNKILTLFNVYLYLTNTRKNTVWIRDYELEVDTGSGYEKMKRVYQILKTQHWDFMGKTHDFDIPDYPEKLIYAQGKLLEYGKPLHGFVLFSSEDPMSKFNDKIKSYKVTCIDAFSKRHVITSSPDSFPNFYLWQDLAGIKITAKKDKGG